MLRKPDRVRKTMAREYFCSGQDGRFSSGRGTAKHTQRKQSHQPLAEVTRL